MKGVKKGGWLPAASDWASAELSAPQISYAFNDVLVGVALALEFGIRHIRSHGDPREPVTLEAIANAAKDPLGKVIEVSRWDDQVAHLFDQRRPRRRLM